MRARHAMRALSGSPLPRVQALSWVGGPVRSLRLARLARLRRRQKEAHVAPVGHRLDAAGVTRANLAARLAAVAPAAERVLVFGDSHLSVAKHDRRSVKAGRDKHIRNGLPIAPAAMVQGSSVQGVDEQVIFGGRPKAAIVVRSGGLR